MNCTTLGDFLKNISDKPFNDVKVSSKTTESTPVKKSIPNTSIVLNSNRALCVLGSSGSGKSSLLEGLGSLLVKDGTKVLHLSMEKDELYVAAGYAAALLNSTKRNMLNPNYVSEHHVFLAQMFTNNFKISSIQKSSHSTGVSIKQIISLLNTGFNPEVLVIDDLFNVISTQGTSEGGYKELQEYCKNSGICLMFSTSAGSGRIYDFDDTVDYIKILQRTSNGDSTNGIIRVQMNSETHEVDFRFDSNTFHPVKDDSFFWAFK
jgi:ABC-type dipeptide/oligopeptide/nickel transport system ATPase component